MNVLSAALFGLIQGLTEFLPVSSSGHLAILQNIFRMENMEESHMTFSVLLHMGTLLAVFVVYWKDILPLFPAFIRMLGKVFHGKFHMADYDLQERMVIFIIIASCPLVGALLINDYVEALNGYTKIIGGILILNAVLLFFSDYFSRGDKAEEDIKPRNALAVGLWQFCALVPGLSRSCCTITGGLTQGFTREFAVKFSFILSIPAVLGANILEVPDMISTPIPSSDVLPYIVGIVVAAVAGFGAMKLLELISRKANFRVFSYYCLAVGILAIIFG